MIVKRYERVAEYINYYKLYINYYYYYYYSRENASSFSLVLLLLLLLFSIRII